VTRIYRLEPDPIRTTLCVAAQDEGETPREALNYACSVLRVFARMHPGDQVIDGEVKAAQKALAGLERDWR
jgi:hypothetical protein